MQQQQQQHLLRVGGESSVTLTAYARWGSRKTAGGTRRLYTAAGRRERRVRERERHLALASSSLSTTTTTALMMASTVMRVVCLANDFFMRIRYTGERRVHNGGDCRVCVCVCMSFVHLRTYGCALILRLIFAICGNTSLDCGMNHRGLFSHLVYIYICILDF